MTVNKAASHALVRALFDHKLAQCVLEYLQILMTLPIHARNLGRK
jgi:hypothetical protein